MRSRVMFFVVLASVWIVLVAARLTVLQVRDHEAYAERASKQHRVEVELAAERGTIYDARGRVLAVSVPSDSVFAVPQAIEDPVATARSLAPILGQSAKKLTSRLSGSGQFVWLRRQLDPPAAQAIRDLELTGIHFVEESRRYYPMGHLAAQVLGYVGIDNKGLSGLELVFDDTLTGRPGRQTLLRDAKRRRVAGLSFTEAERGRDVHLTLDASIQHVVERELEKTVESHEAKSGNMVVLDPRNGAVLAMASYPGFDANDALEHHDLWINRPIADVYEPGSTFKVVTAAAALEAKLIDSEEIFDCGRGSIRIGRTLIRDHHSFDRLNLPMILAKSSNVGIIRAGLRVGSGRLHSMIRAFGFGDKTGIDLPGESRGLLSDVGHWVDLKVAYASFGQSLAVTSIQLASMIGAVGNDGVLVEPYIVAGVGYSQPLRRAPTVRGRPIDRATAMELTSYLEGVVSPIGTGRRAKVKGYRIAGKTGTAQKADPEGGGYLADRHIAGFVGVAPIQNPAIAAAIAIDEPYVGGYDGGTVAAPLFGAVMSEVLLNLGIEPDEARDQPRIATRSTSRSRWQGEARVSTQRLEPRQASSNSVVRTLDTGSLGRGR